MSQNSERMFQNRMQKQSSRGPSIGGASDFSNNEAHFFPMAANLNDPFMPVVPNSTRAARHTDGLFKDSDRLTDTDPRNRASTRSRNSRCSRNSKQSSVNSFLQRNYYTINQQKKEESRRAHERVLTGQRDSRLRESAKYGGTSPRSTGSRAGVSEGSRGRLTQYSQNSKPLSINSMKSTDFKPIINENSRQLSNAKRVKKDNQSIHDALYQEKEEILWKKHEMIR